MKYTVYSKPECPWCDRAKELILQSGNEYEEFVYGKDFTREELATRLQATARLQNDRITVPQVFLGDDYVGTYEDLRCLMGETK